MRTLFKMSRKTGRKHCFLTLIVGQRTKNLEKTLFFRVFCELCKKCLEKREKTAVFSHFSWELVQKAQKTLFFNIFCELSTKCLEKREKTLFSHAFCRT